jgi:hypothetical protein
MEGAGVAARPVGLPALLLPHPIFRAIYRTEMSSPLLKPGNFPLAVGTPIFAGELFMRWIDSEAVRIEDRPVQQGPEHGLFLGRAL